MGKLKNLEGINKDFKSGDKINIYLQNNTEIMLHFSHIQKGTNSCAVLVNVFPITESTVYYQLYCNSKELSSTLDGGFVEGYDVLRVAN